MDRAEASGLYNAVLDDAMRTVEGLRAGTAPRRTSADQYQQQRISNSIREKAAALGSVRGER